MKKLEKKYSASELADAFVFRSTLTAKQQVEAVKQMKLARAKINKQTTEQEKLKSAMLQLRFQIEDYIKSNTYNKALSFGYFLRHYIKLRYKTNKRFAKDLRLDETELSLILNNHRAPSEKVLVRIEIQSTIPALYWYKLVEKQKEYELETDFVLRERESKYVKNRLI